MAGLDRETREMILKSLRDYAKRSLPLEYLLELDRDGHAPREKIKEMQDPAVLGLHLLMIPQEFGGFGAGAYDMYRICEAMARIDLGIATSIFATFLGLDPVRVGGTPEQRRKWMGKVAEECLLVAYGATEAEAGSDLGALKTRAEPAARDGAAGYELTGSKQWISNGGIADLYLVLARAPEGISWFVMEQGAPGLSAAKPEDKHGIRSADTVAFSMDRVFVPAENLVGGVEGQGLQQAQAVFGYTRLMVAAFGLGCGWEALERAIRYSQERIQAGSPLSEKQGYTHKLIVPHAVRLEAARAYIEQTARRLDEASAEGGLQTEGAIAKYFATESGNAAAEAAIQALGGYGYVREFAVEKVKRDVRITQIYEGTSEIMEMTIFRNRWQEHLKSGFAYYGALATKMGELAGARPEVGAGAAALAAAALNAIFERCRAQRLTRAQHVTFKLGELAAEAETAMALCEAAASSERGEALRFDGPTLAAMARIRARDAALKIVLEGSRLLAGAGAATAAELARELQLEAVVAAQAGLLADMDLVAVKLKETFPAG